MSENLLNADAVLGHNAPPEPTAFERVAQRIEDLSLEGRNWLDGQPVANQDQADAVGAILRDMQAVAKEADELRVAEKKVHDDAGKAVQARFHPLIGDTKAGKGKAVRVIEGCKALLAPFLAAENAKKQAAAAEARREADEQQRIAREAMQASTVADVERRERAEGLLRAADQAGKAADRAEKDKATVNGGGRAITARVRHDAVLVDPVAALRHAREVWPDDLKDWLRQRAQQDMDRGVLTIPGFDAEERRTAA